MPCPFCARPAPLFESPLALAFSDAFPLSAGHTLIVPRRHEPDFFALSLAEQAEMLALVADVRRHVDLAHAPAGYNLGVNAGAAAGQTVGHAHLHVIPRYVGDVADPRGGVRWVLPDKAAYW